MKVFEGTYTEETLYEDLLDDIYIVLSDLPDSPKHPQGFKSGIFRVVITREKE
jgi:hypothetical protein